MKIDFIGKLVYKKNWCYLKIDKSVLNHFGEKKLDICFTNNPHISIIKNELFLHLKDKWGENDNKIIKFYFFNDKIYNNGLHNWVDCYSDELCELREFYEIPVLKNANTNEYRVKFHMTIGKFKTPREHISHKNEYRITPRTHIDKNEFYQYV